MKKRLLSIDLTTGPYQSFVSTIASLAAKRESSYVCVANVHMLVEASKDKEFANVVNGADVITPDGMPLAKSLKLLMGIKQERVAGMDLLPDLLEKCAQDNLSVYFYGGTPEILKVTRAFVATNFPSLQVKNYDSPPFREMTTSEMNETAARINDSGANMVVVILGCPKQERWMSRMKGKINACMIGVGGALPVMVGIKKRAPMWMQRAALEWLYRFMQEPTRLGPRYFKTNFAFISLLFFTLMKTWQSPTYSSRYKDTVEESAYSK
jgi:N-acetylglucosaminyldiphosphoundecaprenol N-acetyl-beta-D-mannosaminyltransferase